MANDYDRQTEHHSFAHSMAGTPAFKLLMDAGEEIVPWIIESFARYDAELKKSGQQFGPGWHWGMNWVLVLGSITHETPLKPITEGGFAKWDVNATCRAWVEWFNLRPSVLLEIESASAPS